MKNETKNKSEMKMKTKKEKTGILTKLGVLGVIAAIAMLGGCIGGEKEKPVGNDTLGGDVDEHGCIGSAGYSWCELKQKCLRTFEEKCENETIVGGDRDAHGCIGSAGYSWCEAKQKCLRVWEENCTETVMSEGLCRSAGGNWNECSSKCQLDNQGKQGVACTMQCEALCECAGIAGFKCPEGYACKTPEGIADALGYCVKETAGQKACTEEAKVCPDGTAVGRVGPDCEFAPCPGEAMTIADAMRIAKQSECTEKGNLKEEYTYNNYSKTWWISLDMKPEFRKDYCNPACVVSEETKTAEINWRCTGAIPPEPGKEQACTSSGGTVKVMSCCKSVGDFPNLCLIGACGCAPDQSHDVKTCDCGEGKCFDGSKCSPM